MFHDSMHSDDCRPEGGQILAQMLTFMTRPELKQIPDFVYSRIAR